MTTVGRWSPNKVRERVLNGTWVSAEELGGMVLLTPTSVDITGSGSETATPLANGSVEFSACATLSLNGVFSANYDNYMVAMRGTSSVAANIEMRFRVSGSDNSTASSYVTQELEATSTSVAGVRLTSNQGRIGAMNATQRCGLTTYIYGPFLSQPTAFRTVIANDASSARIVDQAGTHNQSTSYDGFTVISGTGTVTGLVSVYGLVGA